MNTPIFHVCENLYAQSMKISEKLEEYDGNHLYTLYLKALCGFDTKNIISYKGYYTNMEIYPQEKIGIESVSEESLFPQMTQKVFV